MQQPISQLWIDESGDGGCKFEKGSSRFLVLAAVFLKDEGTEIVEEGLMDIRNEMNYSSEQEYGAKDQASPVTKRFNDSSC